MSNQHQERPSLERTEPTANDPKDMAGTLPKDTPLADTKREVCGLVMPISASEGYSADHWSEVRDVLTEAIESAGYTANLVSDADDSGVIHKRIVQNLYQYPLVVCDVSARNPNVMFELGMRLTFDKPTIIVKDDKTDYCFDTGLIEHIAYRRDLRYTNTMAFKNKLKDKLIATRRAVNADSNYSTFLRNFGEFIVPNLSTKEVSLDSYVVDSINRLAQEIETLRIQQSRFGSSRSDPGKRVPRYRTADGAILERPEELSASRLPIDIEQLSTRLTKQYLKTSGTAASDLLHDPDLICSAARYLEKEMGMHHPLFANSKAFDFEVLARMAAERLI